MSTATFTVPVAGIYQVSVIGGGGGGGGGSGYIVSHNGMGTSFKRIGRYMEPWSSGELDINKLPDAYQIDWELMKANPQVIADMVDQYAVGYAWKRIPIKGWQHNVELSKPLINGNTMLMGTGNSGSCIISCKQFDSIAVDMKDPKGVASILKIA